MKHESPSFQRVKASTFGENVDGVRGSQAVMSSWARGERLAMTTHPMLPCTQFRFT